VIPLGELHLFYRYSSNFRSSSGDDGNLCDIFGGENGSLLDLGCSFSSFFDLISESLGNLEFFSFISYPSFFSVPSSFPTFSISFLLDSISFILLFSNFYKSLSFLLSSYSFFYIYILFSSSPFPLLFFIFNFISLFVSLI